MLQELGTNEVEGRVLLHGSPGVLWLLYILDVDNLAPGSFDLLP